MSDKAKKIKKVQVKESDLVTLMDNIVKEAVKDAKAKFLAEQAVKTKSANERRKNLDGDNLLTYCGHCTKSFQNDTKTTHVLQLMFPTGKEHFKKESKVKELLNFRKFRKMVL